MALKDALLFGLDQPLSVYQTNVRAAVAFTSLRKDLERNRSTLATLTAREWKKRKNYSQLKLNARELIQDNRGDHVLSPLLHYGDSDSTKSLNWLILALFTLTPTATASINDNRLSEIYAAIFSNSIRDCPIFDETRRDIIDLLHDICGGQDTANSRAIRNLLPEPSRKRQRLPETSDDPEPLVLKPESLVHPSLDRNVASPDADPNRPVFQFLEARGDKLTGVLPNSALLLALQTGRQWCWERSCAVASTAPDQRRTNSIVAMVPNNDQQDISFILRVGYKAGWEIVKYLDFRSSTETGV
ncbi:hypothetical protein F5883DRAFT_576142 [Diaporthe sp. PMI_573]|nr:hypothetical protein F5883DRAFT_576142 [Diaporthaceae sp. PMI_573]